MFGATSVSRPGAFSSRGGARRTEQLELAEHPGREIAQQHADLDAGCARPDRDTTSGLGVAVPRFSSSASMIGSASSWKLSTLARIQAGRSTTTVVALSVRSVEAGDVGDVLVGDGPPCAAGPRPSRRRRRAAIFGTRAAPAGCRSPRRAASPRCCIAHLVTSCRRANPAAATPREAGWPARRSLARSRPGDAASEARNAKTSSRPPRSTTMPASALTPVSVPVLARTHAGARAVVGGRDSDRRACR